MIHPYIIPDWFYSYEIVFKLAFVIITSIVSIYSYKVYKLSNQKQAKYFSIAFLFFSLSYLIKTFFNLAILTKLGENICVVTKIESINLLYLWGNYINMLFLIVGLITLTYMTFRCYNKQIYLLLIVISVLSVIFSINKMFWFHMLASVLLIFIVGHYFTNFIRHKQVNTFLVLISFIFLFIGHIHFIFAVNHAFFYVIGHFLELFAYLLILINLLLVLKK